MEIPEAHDGALTDALLRQRRSCDELGSPIYVRMIDNLLDDHARSGHTTRLLSRVGPRPVHDAAVLRLLAGMHRLVLDGHEPELARHFPSVGGRPGTGLESAVVQLLSHPHPRLEAEMHLPVQTNEPGRSVAAMTVLGHPWLSSVSSVYWREIGASAGLNLNFLRYAYETSDGVIGDPESRLRFSRDWSATGGSFRIATPSITDIRGCDTDPIDARSVHGRRILESYVWPDDDFRRKRLRAALDIAAEYPPTVERAGAAEWTGRQSAPPGTGLVFFHSIVWQYLDEQTRTAMRNFFETAGPRTQEEPLAWARMEPAGSTADLSLTVWKEGVRRDTIIGTIGYHGQGFILREEMPADDQTAPKR
jgi:hypothetical protein